MSKLLRQVPAPDDQKHYGDYHDYGSWAGTSYAGENDLPLGYWVYITPNWYIFGEAKAQQAMTSQYRASHVTGDPSRRPAPQYPRGRRPPDRLGVADARRPGREWLELRYEKPVKAVAVVVYETYNPGTFRRIHVFAAGGGQQQSFKRNDTLPAVGNKRVVVTPITARFELLEIGRVRIELDSPGVNGWNEIDAVGLLNRSGVTHWATSANRQQHVCRTGKS